MAFVWTPVIMAIVLLSASFVEAAGINATVKIGLCGDGIVDTTEECDGAALGGASCTAQGFGGGELSCLPSCEFDTSACVAPAPEPATESHTSGAGSVSFPVAESVNNARNETIAIFTMLYRALSDAVQELAERAAAAAASALVSTPPSTVERTLPTSAPAISPADTPPVQTSGGGSGAFVRPQGSMLAPQGSAQPTPRGVRESATKIILQLRDVMQQILRLVVPMFPVVNGKTDIPWRLQFAAVSMPIYATIQPVGPVSELSLFERATRWGAGTALRLIRSLFLPVFP